MLEHSRFVVRPYGGTSNTEGASRIHLSYKACDSLSLKAGDLCRIRRGDSESYGYAWPSKDLQLSKSFNTVQLTSTLRDAFNLNLGDHVSLSRVDGKSLLAESVHIEDVTKDDEGLSDEGRFDWEWWAAYSLAKLRVFTLGIGLEVANEDRKKTFVVTGARPQLNSNEGLMAIYRVNYRSTINIVNRDDEADTPDYTPSALQLDPESIGGLKDRLVQLNELLSEYDSDSKVIQMPLYYRRTGGVLLYGQPGVGKSMVLQKLASLPWKKVLTIDESVLGQYVGQTQRNVQKLFDEARQNSPSLILIDNLEAVAGRDDSSPTRSSCAGSTIAAEMDNNEEMNAKVLVVAATNRPNDIAASLRTSARLSEEIEIPIPGAAARTEILRAIQLKDQGFPDPISDIIGAKTHGYVGADLKKLVQSAARIAKQRLYYSESARKLERGAVSGDSDISASPEAEDSGILLVKPELQDFEAALLLVRPTAMREVFIETPQIRWSDIGGQGDVKEALRQVVEWPLKYPNRMKRLGIDAEKGVLLYGPPGCSKTMTAKALATEAGLNFISVKGAELVSKYVGESERAVREVFRKARAASPSIIFLDEIDSLAASREPGQASGLNVVTTLLTELDGIEVLKGVIVVGATNRPNLLDPALMRPGRLDRLIYVGLPDRDARTEILKIRTRTQELASDVDMNMLAERLDGYSGAEIVNICNSAGRFAFRECELQEEEVQISKSHFAQAMKEFPRRITQEMIETYNMWHEQQGR